MPNDNREALDHLFHRLRTDFGHASGQAIIRAIIEELGGLRVTVPDFKDLYREERNRRIIARFNGANYNELAECFGLHVRTVRKIIDGGRHGIEKNG